MKISDFSTDKGMDIICEITVNVNNILSDEKFSDLLKTYAKNKKAEVKSIAQKIAFGASVLNDAVPYLLREKRSDVIHILAVLNETTDEEIKNQKLVKTMAQIKEATEDEDLIALFH